MKDTDPISTVLIVEDEILVRMYGADLLTEAGFEVIEAGNADEALAILSGLDHVHLLFSDIDMPGSMDGLDLAKIVHERWPHVRLLLTSGHHRLDVAHLPSEGEFVRKPWAQEALIDRIRQLLVH